VKAVEDVAISELKPHPRNYRGHPDDQLEHIVQSIKLHGFYRNVVVAKDNTILAGHGVVQAAKKLRKKTVPVIRLDIASDDPRALKLLAGDNEIGNLAEDDDRKLTEMLKEVMDSIGLEGTGFNAEQLAALALVTRPAEEFASFNEASAWVGLPGFEEGGIPIRLVIGFRSDEDRAQFVEKFKIRIDKSAIKGQTWSTRWPWTDREKTAGVRFETMP
jgi:hypothetical protein